jgi:O-antigen/teichoic acid export membrane protein
VGRRHELITVLKDAGAPSAIAEPETIHAEPKRPTRRKLLPFGLTFSPETALHQGFLSLADQAVASITNFVTGVIIARASSKEEFGLYMLGFTLILLVTDLQTSLIATPYMVYAPRLKGHAHALYAGSTLIHQVVFSLVTMVVLACAAFAARFGVGPRGLEPVLWALAAVVALIMLREFVRRICFAGLKLRTVFLFDTCIGVGQIGGLLLLAHFGLLSASTAYWLIGSACGIAVLWWLWLDRNFYHVRLDESVADLKKNWIFGKWVFASGLVWTGSTNLYPWLLAFFHGTAAAGVFAACVGVVSASNPALLGIQNLLGPKIAHEFATKGRRSLRRLVLKISATLALPVSLLTLVLILWGDRFIALLYGSRYAGNGLVVAILALNLLVTAVGFSFSRALFAIERANVDFVLNLAALFIMLTLGLWLVRTYGPLGAASGLFAANIVTSIVRAGAFLSAARIPDEQESN